MTIPKHNYIFIYLSRYFIPAINNTLNRYICMLNSLNSYNQLRAITRISTLFTVYLVKLYSDKQYFTIKIKADSPLTRLSALNSSKHIQFHYYLISSEPYNFLSYHNLYGFRHLRTEYSCCLHIQAS